MRCPGQALIYAAGGGVAEFGFVTRLLFLWFRMRGVVPFVSFVLLVGLVEFIDPVVRSAVPF